MRIVLADDAALLREGLAGLLSAMGHEIVGQAVDAPGLLACVEQAAASGELPELIVTDVRMPPTMSDDGLRAAVQIREKYPQVGICVLSQYVAPAYAAELFSSNPLANLAVTPVGRIGGTGYLLKERVSNIEDFASALETISAGGVVVDPEVAGKLINGRGGVLATLTERENEVLSLMAQGLSNPEICEKLFLSPGSVSKYVAGVFTKLGLQPDDTNRRVRAVLIYLNQYND